MTTLTQLPTRPAPKLNGATASQHYYLRGLGYRIEAGDPEQGGVWLSRGPFSMWFATADDAARAVVHDRLPRVMVG